MKTIFKSSQFTPTQWDTAEQKAKFANHFVNFVESGYKQSKFPKWFYVRLSMTFGHIAHTSQLGFYWTFFSSDDGIERFKNATMSYGCYGSPRWTYSDVEKALQDYYAKKGW